MCVFTSGTNKNGVDVSVLIGDFYICGGDFYICGGMRIFILNDGLIL